MRARFFLIFIIFIFIFLISALINLQVLKGTQYRQLSEKNCIRLVPQQGSRGRIFDSNGKVIVDSYLSYDLMLLPEAGQDTLGSLAQIYEILGSEAGAGRIFKNINTKSFVPLTVAKNINIKKAFTLEELKPQIGNIMIQPSPLRSYPYQELACHALGYLNEIDHTRLMKLSNYGYKSRDIVGFGGVEEKYDYYLRQEEGGLSVEVDNRGRFMRVLGFKPPKSGKDIQLGLDLKLQVIAEKHLEGRRGSIIIIDPYDGRIKTMVSKPGFNPAVFIDKPTALLRRILKGSEAPLFNRSISGAYPAGSVFKLVVATAALESGKLNPAKSFFCSKSFKIGSREFSCWDHHGQQNLISAIKYSCNVFFYRIGLLAGAQAIADYALKFGFGRATYIDLPQETSGLVPSPLRRRFYKFKNWFDGDTANLSIGQGDLLVTPLQVARMIAVFANKGVLVNPYLVCAIDGQDTSHLRKKPSSLNLKDSTIDLIREGLRRVVSEEGGTAYLLSKLPVDIAGKTGTAQAGRGEPHGWFAGFFPFNKPAFVICVFLEHGGSGHAAAIVVKQIMEDMQKEGLI